MTTYHYTSNFKVSEVLSKEGLRVCELSIWAMSLASLGSCLLSAPFLQFKENGYEKCSMRVEPRLVRQNPLPQIDNSQALKEGLPLYGKMDTAYQTYHRENRRNG